MCMNTDADEETAENHNLVCGSSHKQAKLSVWQDSSAVFV